MTIRVICRNGVFEPLVPVDLEENQQVEVAVTLRTSSRMEWLNRVREIQQQIIQERGSAFIGLGCPTNELTRSCPSSSIWRLTTVSSRPLLRRATHIATHYGRSVYDALFVALTEDIQVFGVTADEPLYNAVRHDFPNVRLLRDL
jgi:predicted DNA-binding antitoxin AbrB/MazE fold protein